MPHFSPALIRASAVMVAVALAFATTPATAAEDPTLTLSELGAENDLSLPGRTVEVPLSFRVPDGTRPETLTGQLQLPAEYTGGVVEIHQDNRMYSTTVVEMADFTAGIALPLDGITVEDARADITLRAVLDVDGDQWCIEEPAALLRDAAVSFTGSTTSPMVVAEFLPPVLKKISIHVPADPAETVQAAALEVATSVASVYQPIDLDVEVVQLPPGTLSPAAGPEDFERQIVLVDDRPEGRTELVNPGEDDTFLRLSGGDGTLYDQTRLLTDTMLPLAADVEVTPAGFGDIPDLSADVATLAELGNYNLISESVARTRILIGVERSRLRPYATSLEVHLTGTYTPLPERNSGQLTAVVGDTVVDAFTADETGVIDRRFTVPGELMDRYVEIGVELRTLGEVSCGHTQPVGLNIDADSVVTAENSDTPLLRGFRVLPQSFQPGVDVALAAGDVAHLSRAVRVLTGVQSLSSQRIRPHLVNWDEAVASSRSTILVDAEGSRLDQVPTYLNQAATAVEISDESRAAPSAAALVRSLNTSSELSWASLQAVWDDNTDRMLLVASSTGAAAQLDELLDWLEGDEDRWAGLDGEILVRIGEREPVELKVAAAPESAAEISRSAMVAAVAAVAVVLAIALTLWSLRRRKRQQNKNLS